MPDLNLNCLALTDSSRVFVVYVRKVVIGILSRGMGRHSVIRLKDLIPNNNYEAPLGIMFSCGHSQYLQEKGLGWCGRGYKGVG